MASTTKVKVEKFYSKLKSHITKQLLTLISVVAASEIFYFSE